MSTINQKRFLWAVISLIIVATCILVFNNSKNTTTANTISVETYKVEQGWGYLIRKGKKKIINQPYMPCIAGNQPFPSEISALKTGELVADKVKKDELPTITTDELNSIIKNQVE